MNEPSSSSRTIIVVIGMAVVVGIGALTLGLRSHRLTPVAQIPIVPAAVPQTPDAASSVAQTADAAGTVPQTLEAPTSVAQRDRLGSTAGDTPVPTASDAKAAATEPKSASYRHVAGARTGVGTTNRTAAGTSAAASSSERLADATVASSMDGGNSVDVPTTPSAPPSGMAANVPEVAMTAEPAVSSTESVAPSSAPVASSIEPAASDTQITTAVKSEIAADGSGEDARVGVSTTNGVVVLTGTLATQDAIDHIKGIAEKVQDVKSVDTSALKITIT
jgi:hyperosmotically inducible periplasmic protein